MDVEILGDLKELGLGEDAAVSAKTGVTPAMGEGADDVVVFAALCLLVRGQEPVFLVLPLAPEGVVLLALQDVDVVLVEVGWQSPYRSTFLKSG